MKQTKDVITPTMKDIMDRDSVIRNLTNLLNEQFDQTGRPDTVLILDTVDNALEAIGPKPSFGLR